MLEMAAGDGTTDIVGTPHSDLSYAFQPEVIDERVRELNAALGGRIRIHQGCDFHLHFDNIQDCLQNPTKYTINHQRYLLVEFADAQIPGTTEEVFQRMVHLGHGHPVITHPERNPLLRKRMDEIAQWVRAGCLIQVTAQSFLDRFGKQARQAADELMERRMVHFIASDAHDTEHRPPLLVGGLCVRGGSLAGAAQATALFAEHPRATLTGRYLEVGDPVGARRKKKRWFW